jgi:hypothetical protein
MEGLKHASQYMKRSYLSCVLVIYTEIDLIRDYNLRLTPKNDKSNHNEPQFKIVQQLCLQELSD